MGIKSNYTYLLSNSETADLNLDITIQNKSITGELNVKLNGARQSNFITLSTQCLTGLTCNGNRCAWMKINDTEPQEYITPKDFINSSLFLILDHVHSVCLVTYVVTSLSYLQYPLVSIGFLLSPIFPCIFFVVQPWMGSSLVINLSIASFFNHIF